MIDMLNKESSMSDEYRKECYDRLVGEAFVIKCGLPIRLPEYTGVWWLDASEIREEYQHRVDILKNSLTRFNIKGVCDEDRTYLQMAHGFSDSEIDSLFKTYKKQLCNKIYDYGKEDRKKWHQTR